MQKTYAQLMFEERTSAAKESFSKIHSATNMKPDKESHSKATPSSSVKHSLTYHAKDSADAKAKMAHLHDAISKVHKHTKTENIPGGGEVHHYKSSVNGKRISMSHARVASHEDGTGPTKHSVVVTHGY